VEVRERIIFLARAMQPIRAQPDHSLGLIVPSRTSVIVPVTKAVDREIAGRRSDRPSSDWIRCALGFERTDDRMYARVGEDRPELETEIRNEATLRNPEVVSLTDARAAMPSKMRSTVHGEGGASLCS
jgi:hypothetical protein